MSELNVTRYVRAARRVAFPYALTGSPVSASFLAWLTTKAAGGAVLKFGEADSNSDNMETGALDAPAPDAGVKKSSGHTAADASDSPAIVD